MPYDSGFVESIRRSAAKTKVWALEKANEAQQKATEYAITKAWELGAQAASATAETIKQHGPEMASAFSARVARNTGDALDPRHVITALSNPEEAKRYVGQYTQPIRDLPQIFYDPVGMTTRHFYRSWQGIRRFTDLYRQLDPGRKVGHAGSAALDTSLDSAAETIGVAAIFFAAARLPGNRAKTDAMRQRLFPREEFFRGAFSRRFPLRFTLGNPLSRVAALPVLYGTFAAYVFASKTGRAIEDRQYLQEHQPQIHESLEASNLDYRKATTYRGFSEAIQQNHDPRTENPGGGGRPWPFG